MAEPQSVAENVSSNPAVLLAGLKGGGSTHHPMSKSCTGGRGGGTTSWLFNSPPRVQKLLNYSLTSGLDVVS